MHEDGNVQSKTTREFLRETHPQGRAPVAEILLHEPEINEAHHDPNIFQRMTGEAVKAAANKTQGTAGPSGVDAYTWRRFCSSFKSASVDLWNAMAALGRRLCTSSVHPESLSAYVACRLIPIDKSPEVRPISKGEVPRRIIAKFILKVVSNDIHEAASMRGP